MKKAARAFTLETARATLLAKLQKAGAKGFTSLAPASTAPEKLAVLNEAGAALEREQAMFVDRRKARPRYYTWASRPELPTVESVAKLLAKLMAEAFPTVSTAATLKSALKKHKDEAPLLAPALAHLVTNGAVQVLKYAKGKKVEELYIPAAQPEAPAQDFDPEQTREAYQALAARTGFPSVAISALRRESGAPLAPLQRWLQEEHRAGRAVLAMGDWSLAEEEKRQAAIEWLGQPHLLVRLLS